MEIEIVIRNDASMVLAYMSSSKPLFSKLALFKCWALWHTIFFCEELGLHKVQFEGDAKGLIQAFKGTDKCWSWSREPIKDVKAALINRLY